MRRSITNPGPHVSWRENVNDKVAKKEVKLNVEIREYNKKDYGDDAAFFTLNLFWANFSCHEFISKRAMKRASDTNACSQMLRREQKRPKTRMSNTMST